MQNAKKYLRNVVTFHQINTGGALFLLHYTTGVLSRRRQMVVLCLLFGAWYPGNVSGQNIETMSIPYPDTSLAYKLDEAMLVSRYNLDSSYSLIYNIYTQSIAQNYPFGMFQSALFLGILHSFQGEYVPANKWFITAISYSNITSRPVFHLCRAVNNIGNLLHFQGDYQRAIQYYFSIIPIAERTLPQDSLISNPLIGLYTSTASLLTTLEDYEKALYYLDKAEIMAHKYECMDRLPPVYAYKALVYGKTGDKNKASEYNNRALDIGVQTRNEEVQFMAFYNMATISESEDAALSYIKKAHALKGNINQYYRTAAITEAGAIYLRQKNYPQALRILNQAESLASHYKMPKTLLSINQHLADLHTQTGNYKKAHDHRLLAYKMNDSLLNKEKALAINALEIKYRTAQKDMELSQQQLFIKQQEERISRNNVVIGISAMGILMLTSISLFLYMLNRSNRQKQYLQQQKIQSLEQEQEIRELKAVMAGEEKERTRLARELHDGIGGMVAAIKMNFSSLRKRYAPVTTTGEEPEQNNGFTKIMDLINTTGNEIRETAHNLMPDILTRHGLVEALNLYTTKINSGNNVYIKLQADDQINNIPQSIQLSLYRVIQELVQNIIKHASASIAMIHISTKPDGVVHIVIRDNGKGFDTDAIAEGIGLQNVRSRIKILHGTLSVASAPGEGVTVEIRININNLKDIPV
jgi:signal transduction histidine kinase